MRFVRVVHRRGWDVEFIEHGGPAAPDVLNFATREEAISHAESLAPEWIEVGEVVPAGDQPQHHRWTTLRRQADGKYAGTALNWGR